jgi:hypothetical protein
MKMWKLVCSLNTFYRKCSSYPSTSQYKLLNLSQSCACIEHHGYGPHFGREKNFCNGDIIKVNPNLEL